MSNTNIKIVAQLLNDGIIDKIHNSNELELAMVEINNYQMLVSKFKNELNKRKSLIYEISSKLTAIFAEALNTKETISIGKYCYIPELNVFYVNSYLIKRGDDAKEIIEFKKPVEIHKEAIFDNEIKDIDYQKEVEYIKGQIYE